MWVIKEANMMNNSDYHVGQAAVEENHRGKKERAKQLS